MHAEAALPRLRHALHLRPQRDQFGQRRHDALARAIGAGRGRASGPHGTGTFSSNAATSRSPSQPSARAS